MPRAYDGRRVKLSIASAIKGCVGFLGAQTANVIVVDADRAADVRKSGAGVLEPPSRYAGTNEVSREGTRVKQHAMRDWSVTDEDELASDTVLVVMSSCGVYAYFCAHCAMNRLQLFVGYASDWCFIEIGNNKTLTSDDVSWALGSIKTNKDQKNAHCLQN